MSDNALTPRERAMLAVDAKVEQLLNETPESPVMFPGTLYGSAIERAALAVIIAIHCIKEDRE